MPIQALPAAIGAAQLLSSARSRKKATGAMPNMVDPEQLSRLGEAKLMLQSMRAGNDPTTQAGLREARQMAAQTGANAIRAGAGNPGFALDALRMAQRGYGENVNRVLGNLTPMTMQQQGFVNDVASSIEQRRLDLGLLNRAQLSAEAAQRGKDGWANLFGAIAMGMPQDMDLNAIIGAKKQGGVPAGIPSGSATSTFNTQGLADAVNSWDGTSPTDFMFSRNRGY